MKEQPFFTIVMPVYQAEDYIKAALHSIKVQSFKDFELLVIEDSSPDQSAKIIAEEIKDDERITLIRQEKNEGVSKARNLGLAKAKGKYLWYMDADDEVDNDLLQNVYNSLQKNPAKMVIFGLIEEYYDAKGNYLYNHKIIPTSGYFKNRKDFRPYILALERETLYGYVWNKVYETEFLRNKKIQFEDYQEAKFIEDILFNIKVMNDLPSLNILSIAPYHYGKRESANLTNEFTEDYFPSHKRRIEALYNQQVYWKQDGADTRRILGSLYGRYILSAMTRNVDKKSKMSFGERRDFLVALYNDEIFKKLIPYGKSKNSKSLGLWLTLLKQKRIILCLLMAKGVHFAKHRMTKFYNKTKSER